MQHQIILSGEKLHVIDKENPNFLEIRDLLLNDKIEEALKLASSIDVEQKIKDLGYGISVSGNTLKIGNYEINNSLSRFIVDKVKNANNTELLASFIYKLNQLAGNKDIFDSIWDFLLHNDDIIITDQGYIIAYKAVTHDFKDKYTGSIDNSIGQTVSEPKAQVDPNRDNACSYGLHVGSLKNYVRGFANSNDRVILVSVNLDDIVSVPFDSNCGKMRVSKYYVIDEISSEYDYDVEDQVEEYISLAQTNSNYHRDIDWSYVRDI